MLFHSFSKSLILLYFQAFFNFKVFIKALSNAYKKINSAIIPIFYKF
ncbi:hypothetical protein HCMG_00751 [Helicobacter canadensis MIT 98-5491]|nr:hypothetical protein HCMG_00751 [Helicobacter canadensis MIT 98-5491]